LPTSFDYSKLLPDIAPQYLRDWAEARRWKNHALIWRVVWEREPITGIKHRCAEAFCTACGKKLLLDYVPGGTCNGSGYSPSLFIKCGIVHNWSYTFCPECGAEVRSEHVTGATGYAGEYCYPMTLHHVDMKEKSNRLAMIFWQVEKQHRKDGRRTISIMPWEAYIVEEKGIVRCTHHGSCMYSDYSLGFWRQTVKFTDPTLLSSRWSGTISAGVSYRTEETGTVTGLRRLQRLKKSGWRGCCPAARNSRRLKQHERDYQ